MGSADVVSTGVAGLDEVLGGGIPQGHTVTLLGPFGTGKTTMGLQFLWEGIRRGEKGLFISLEEEVPSLLETAEGFGWDLRKAAEEKGVTLLRLEPADVRATVARVKGELPSFIRGLGARRVVVDSISLLGMMFDAEAERRSQLFSLCKQLREAGATSLLTAEAREGNPWGSKDGLAEYVSDGVISLQYDLKDARDLRLVLQVVKMRRMKHSRALKPYAIGPGGIRVLSDTEVF
jgi:KaiC domain protein